MMTEFDKFVLALVLPSIIILAPLASYSIFGKRSFNREENKKMQGKGKPVRPKGSEEPDRLAVENTHQIASEAANAVLDNVGITLTVKSLAVTTDIIESAIEKAIARQPDGMLSGGMQKDDAARATDKVLILSIEAADAIGDLVARRYGHRLSGNWCSHGVVTIVESAIEKAYEQGKKDGVREHYVGK